MSQIEIKKILCPTDFSEPSKKAVLYAVALSKKYEAKLYLFHAIEPVLTTALVGHSLELAAHLEAELEDDAEKRLKDLSIKLDYENIEIKVVRGKAFDEIVGFSKEAEVNLIVMGTHGRTGLSHFFMGSTAEKVVRKAFCPVLTVKANEKDFIHPLEQ